MIQNDKLLREILDQKIEKVNHHMQRILQSENRQMQEVMDWLLSTPGKQIRPKMLLVSAQFGEEKNDATELAAILEIMHMASLVHDDVIDDADDRRGKPSVQKKFGKNMAVYSGDYMIFCAFSKNKLAWDAKYRSLFSALNKICYGELGQNSSLFHLDIKVEDYIKNITGKTASMFELACECGALAGNAKKEIKKTLANFGKNFGILFQIHDDLLDFGMGSKQIGKPLYQDFANGVYSLPVLYSAEDTQGKSELKRIQKQIVENGLTVELCKQITELIEAFGGFEKCRKKANEYYDLANEALIRLPTGAERNYFQNLLDTFI